jgi:hypothetical protein
VIHIKAFGLFFAIIVGIYLCITFPAAVGVGFIVLALLGLLALCYEAAGA